MTNLRTDSSFICEAKGCPFDERIVNGFACSEFQSDVMDQFGLYLGKLGRAAGKQDSNTTPVDFVRSIPMFDRPSFRREEIYFHPFVLALENLADRASFHRELGS